LDLSLPKRASTLSFSNSIASRSTAMRVSSSAQVADEPFARSPTLARSIARAAFRLPESARCEDEGER